MIRRCRGSRDCLGEMAVDAVQNLWELLRRGSELRTRSVQIRAVAHERMDKSNRLLAAGAAARMRMVGSPDLRRPFRAQ